MLTSQKRTNLYKILGLFLGFCCLVLLTGCQSDKISEPNNQTVDIQISENKYQNMKVKTTVSTPVYVVENNKPVEIGLFEPNVYLDINDQASMDGKIQIQGTPWYVDQNSVEDSGRWFKNQTHLIPFNKVVITKENYTIEDTNGIKQATINHSDEYELYVLNSDEDSRFGVLFQNAIYYIQEDDVLNIKDSEVQNDLDLADSIPVMMYHFFYDESLGEVRQDVNFVEKSEFVEQMTYLKDNNFTSLTMREVLYFMENRAQVPSKSFALTIDDGHESVYRIAYPILKENKINATMFLITGWMDPTIPYEFIEMKEEGIEMQSHSFLMHQGGCSGMGHGGRIQCVDQQEGIDDTIRSYEYVDGGFVYCYPFGDVNENAKQIMKGAGTKLAFTTQFGKIRQGYDLLELPRIRVTGGAGINQFINQLN